jgi:hypothetical protein
MNKKKRETYKQSQTFQTHSQVRSVHSGICREICSCLFLLILGFNSIICITHFYHYNSIDGKCFVRHLFVGLSKLTLYCLFFLSLCMMMILLRCMVLFESSSLAVKESPLGNVIHFSLKSAV